MKLDVTDLRYVTPEEFRVLTAVRTAAYTPSILGASLNFRHFRLRWAQKITRWYLLHSSSRYLASEMEA